MCPATPCTAGTRSPAQVSAFRKPSNNANGNTRDRQGRIVTCEHLTRRVTRTEYDGRITVLADSFEGKRLNSPNDVVVKSDGSVWFTDPIFGISGFYEGEKAQPELPPNVYRIDADGSMSGRGRRHQPAQWPGVLARRIDSVRGRVALEPAQDPGARRGRRRAHAGQPAGGRSMRALAHPTAFASTSTATCGVAGAWARPVSTASMSSTRRAS